MKKIHHLSIVTLALSVSACTFNVTSTADRVDINPGDGDCIDSRGQCTLRAAIMEANELTGLWRIAVPAGQYVLDSGIEGGVGLTIERNMRIQGAGSGATVIDGDGNSRVFLVNSGDNVQFQSLSIVNGDGQFGGGMFVDGGKVFLNDVRFFENDAFTGGGGLLVSADTLVEGDNVEFDGNFAVGAFGGAVLNQGRLVLRQSLFYDNESNRAGALHNSVDAQLNLFNVTMSGNRGRSDGRSVGGMLNQGFAVLRNTTVTDNEGGGATGAGGLQMTSVATTVSKNSLFAENFRRTGSTPIGSDCKGTFSSDSRYNLVQARDNCNLPAATSTWLLDLDAGLLGLGANGGATRTHPLGTDSPAIDAGYPYPPGTAAADACRATDQRGVPRPQTLFSETGDGRCDIGAYEAGHLPSFISGFTLVNANTDIDIGPLRNGDVLILSDLPSELSVRADVTEPGLTESITFGYDSDPAIRTENASPYSVAGDSSGNYTPFDFGETGEHTLVATPYSGDGGTGSGGGGKSIVITVFE